MNGNLMNTMLGVYTKYDLEGSLKMFLWRDELRYGDDPKFPGGTR